MAAGQDRARGCHPSVTLPRPRTLPHGDCLAPLGIEVDPARNRADSHQSRVVSTDASAVTVLVVPTNEELSIARQAVALLG